MSWSALRRASAIAGLFWMVAGIAAHNLGWETLSIVCVVLVYVAIAVTLWAWVGRP